MKKFFSFVAIIATAFTMNSCNFGNSTAGNITTGVLNGVLGNGTTANNTGSTTANVAGSVLSSVLGGNAGSNGNLVNSGISILSSLLGGNTVSTKTIVGTWSYNQPEVSLESNNALAKIGGELVATKVEKALSTQLEKIGMKRGVTSFTFGSDGKVSMKLGSKNMNGTYTLNGNTLNMKGAFGLTSLTATVSIQGNQLYMLFDAKSVFSIITKLGSSASSISSVLGNFNGLKLGWSMTK